MHSLLSPDLLDFDDALALVLRHAASLAAPAAETVELAASRGRVLAEALTADRDQPPFHRSTRDGFAVRAAELNAGAVTVTGLLRAGELWTAGAVAGKSAIEIMTGAPVPAGVDAVVMIEHVLHADGHITLQAGRSVAAGENIVPTGSEARSGETLLRPGTRIGAAEIALAASCGVASLAVYRRPRVAIVATGDELVELHESPLPHQIRNSNSYALASLVEDSGGEALRLPHAADTRESLTAAIHQAQDCDLLLLSGGVSVGKYDFVKDALTAEGAEFLFAGVRMQPGRPVVFGRIPARGQRRVRYFFGLPGNPVSTQVTFLVFARTLLAALAGAGAQSPNFAAAILSEDIQIKPGLARFLPAILTRTFPPTVRVIATQGSGDLAANARANCYAVLPPEREHLAAGESVSILLR